MTLQPGALLDNKYRVVKLIGQGGMGAVYEGNHELIDRRVAIKVLLSTAEQANAVARFEREARAAGRIGNDHILEVLDIGSLADGSRYMVMEFLDGESLASRIESRLQLPEAEVARIALQLLDGLGAAHAAGVLHRDLKPDNIFLVRQKAGHRDFVKIIDFGISKFQALNQPDEMRMTATGTVVGTPYYISPEQAKGLGDTDHRSDLYAVGVILYEALAGRVPFLADNFNNLLFKIVLEEAPPLESLVPSVDPLFAALVHKAMARDRDARYQTAAELAAALADWAKQRGVALDGSSDAGRASLVSGEVAARPASSPALQTAVGATVALGGSSARAVASVTPGAFGASQPVETLPLPKKKAPVGLIVAGVVGALVIAGTSVLLLSVADEDPAQASASAESATAEATSVSAAAPSAPAAAPAPEPLDAAPAPPPEPSEPAAVEKTEDEPKERAEDKEKSASSSARSTAPRSTGATRRTAAPRPTAAPPPALATATPTPAPAPAPTSTSNKRRYFGY